MASVLDGKASSQLDSRCAHALNRQDVEAYLCTINGTDEF